jgi:hypothetical protein
MSDHLPNRAARRKAKKQGDLGPAQDPIRQQGRDPHYEFVSSEWFETPQKCDRSRLAGKPRQYHTSNQTSSGHSFDEHFEVMAAMARELEAAGINLGWGGYAGTWKCECEIVQEIKRRYGGRPNAWASKLNGSKNPSEP